MGDLVLVINQPMFGQQLDGSLKWPRNYFPQEPLRSFAVGCSTDGLQIRDVTSVPFRPDRIEAVEKFVSWRPVEICKKWNMWCIEKMCLQLTEYSRIQPGLQEGWPVCLLSWVCSFEQNATQSQTGPRVREPERQGWHWGLIWRVNALYGSEDSFDSPSMKRGASWARKTTVPISAPKPANEIWIAVWTDLTISKYELLELHKLRWPHLSVWERQP